MSTSTALHLPEESISKPQSQALIIAAWMIMLIVSMLPNIVLREVFGISNTAWLIWPKVGFLAILVAAGFFWQAIRPLRSFLIILAAIYLVEFGGSQLAATSIWRGWFGGQGAPFTQEMMGIQLTRLLVAVVMILVMLGLRYRPKDFFLVTGNLRATANPVKWLGLDKPESWMRFGTKWAIFISLGTLAFLVLSGRPSGEALLLALPMLPAVLLFASINAFGEEMTYRSTLLGTLEGPLGGRNALLMAAVFFGIAHFYGVPYGVLGVVMATFLGWMLGKAMLETRGFCWAWFIHFLQDVAIFSFMAVGSITPGGG
jgi:membrane protease YdiL (CAAX protease family)